MKSYMGDSWEEPDEICKPSENGLEQDNESKHVGRITINYYGLLGVCQIQLKIYGMTWRSLKVAVYQQKPANLYQFEQFYK